MSYWVGDVDMKVEKRIRKDRRETTRWGKWKKEREKSFLIPWTSLLLSCEILFRADPHIHTCLCREWTVRNEYVHGPCEWDEYVRTYVLELWDVSAARLDGESTPDFEITCQNGWELHNLSENRSSWRSNRMAPFLTRTVHEKDYLKNSKKTGLISGAMTQRLLPFVPAMAFVHEKGQVDHKKEASGTQRRKEQRLASII